jgi:hypothetical protein
MKKILFLTLLLLLNGCSQSSKDLNLVCSGNIESSADISKKQRKFDAQSYVFNKGELLYRDSDKNDNPINTFIKCNWSDISISCKGNLADKSPYEFYVDRVSGSMIERVSNLSYNFNITSEGRCEIVKNKKF